MKRIKKLTLSTISCIIFILSLHCLKAQDKAAASASLKESTPEQRANMQTMVMKSKLQLDSVQMSKVRTINLKYAQKMQPILNGDEGRFKRLRDMMKIQKDKDADLKAVLTKDQMKQYEAMKADMQEKLKEAKNEKQ